MEYSYTFDLNTAITPRIPTDSQLDESTHKELIMPLRAEIMKHDGVVGCHISRYGIKVSYLTTVINFDAVTRIVQDIVTQAAQQEGLFPFKHEKTPAVVLPEKSKPADKSKDPLWVYANFSTHLTRLPAGMEGFDQQRFWEETADLLEELLDHDGIIDYALRRSQAGLRFDPELTTYDEIEAHIKRVFVTAAHSDFFPFLHGAELELDFFTKS